jgi:(2Fe-2S) ferredoxin
MKQVLICQHINCMRNGSEAVLRAFEQTPVANTEVTASECQGQCNMGVTVRILPDNTWYCRIKPDDVPEIIQQHLKDGQPVDHLLHPRMHPRFG